MRDNSSSSVVGGKLSFQYGGTKMTDDSKLEGKIYFSQTENSQVP